MTVQIINDMNHNNLMVIYSLRAEGVFSADTGPQYCPSAMTMKHCHLRIQRSKDPNPSSFSNALHFQRYGLQWKIWAILWPRQGNRTMKIPLPDLQSELTAGGNCRALGLNPSWRAAAISENKNSYKVCSKAWYNDLIIQYHFLAANWTQRSREHCLHKDWLNLYIPIFGSQPDPFNGWIRI